jgi:hypothetical protein
VATLIWRVVNAVAMTNQQSPNYNKIQKRFGKTPYKWQVDVVDAY